MIFDYRTGAYLGAVLEALEVGDRIDPKYLTNICPECNERVEWINSGYHVVTPVTQMSDADRVASGDWNVYVVIGCEEYWVIPPASVDIPSDSWQDWTSWPEDVTPENFA